MIDEGLLIIGLVRVAIWVYGFYLFTAHKRLLGTLGFGINAVNSLIFAFNNAGVKVQPWMQDYATIMATPAVALIVGGLMLMFAEDDRGLEGEHKWKL